MIFRSLFLLVSLSLSTYAVAGDSPDKDLSCREEVLSALSEFAPQYRSFVDLSEASGTRCFEHYLNCRYSSEFYRIATAIHECIHIMGQRLPQGDFDQTYWIAPNEILYAEAKSMMPQDDTYDDLDPEVRDRTSTQHYVKGRVGGIRMIFEELNAYTHGLEVSTLLQKKFNRFFYFSKRDGVLLQLYYLATYLKVAEESSPQAWEGIISDPEYVQLITTLWTRAQNALLKACRYKNLGLNDRALFGLVYQQAKYVKPFFDLENKVWVNHRFEGCGNQKTGTASKVTHANMEI